ncbi:hypothetical protein ACS0TY_006791 [Phlomoides rotata]
MVDGDAVASLKRFFSVSHDAPPPGSARARPPPPPGTAAAPNFEGFCERKQQIAGAILKQRGDDMNSTRFHLVHEVRRRIIFDRGRRRSIRCPSTSLVNGRNRAFDRGKYCLFEFLDKLSFDV